jgi:hypothetical protein
MRGSIPQSNKGFLVSINLHYESHATRVSIGTKQRFPEIHVFRSHNMQKCCRFNHSQLPESQSVQSVSTTFDAAGRRLLDSSIH